jgi:DNA polymerase V
MTAIDNVNARFGKFTVVPATQRFKREWKLCAETK